MSEWSNNNRAHGCVWFFECYHHSRKTAFLDAAEWKTSDLIGVVAGDGKDIVGDKARAHAILLDEVFIKLYGATYEPGITQIDATSSLEAALAGPDNKIVTVGEVADEKYKFIGEI